MSLLALPVVVLVSLLLCLPLRRRRLRIHAIRIQPLSLSLHGLSYSSPHQSISSPHAHLALRVPTPSKPTFLTLTVDDYVYADHAHRVSVSALHATLSLFPVPPDTIVAVTLHDFRVRIFTSEHTPTWLQSLRENLIRTVLNGEWIRLDHLCTKVVFSTAEMQGTQVVADDGEGDSDVDEQEQQHEHRLPYKDKHYSYMDEASYVPKPKPEPEPVASTSQRSTSPSPGTKTLQPTASPASSTSSAPHPSQPKDEDEEAVLTLTASEWHITTFQHRLYTFGTLDAQLRHTWHYSSTAADDHPGSFVMVAKNCAWVLASIPPVPPPPDASRSKSKVLLGLKFLLSPLGALLPFLTLPQTLLSPLSLLTLHIPRLDVTFDRFRLRDAELVRQGAEFLTREWSERTRGRKRKFELGDFLWDACVQGLLGTGEGEGGRVRAGEYYREVGV